MQYHNSTWSLPKSKVLHIFRPSLRRYSQKRNPSHPNRTPHLGSPEPHSLSARLKKLTREYGYTVVGVYFALSIADFPLCFLAVKVLGAERVAHAEHAVIGGTKSLVQRIFPSLFRENHEENTEVEASRAEENAEAADGAEASEYADANVTTAFWTQLALAFVIHKSFIFIRVPLTAAVTPKVVKTLRGWGYDIGKRRPKVPKMS
ncbi:hypothetical protein CC80DRAFT_401332 [Byssothecium circinans]|uniref:DUF1279 domain-containing protein n=1 Tax=Byssothecium circinans TaxID=147558 RepID=A0A6A5UG27_9PLEO|nr:hypothetical protein CC80DRAFT_401332 [Byssothecium circinans]